MSFNFLISVFLILFKFDLHFPFLFLLVFQPFILHLFLELFVIFVNFFFKTVLHWVFVLFIFVEVLNEEVRVNIIKLFIKRHNVKFHFLVGFG